MYTVKSINMRITFLIIPVLSLFISGCGSKEGATSEEALPPNTLEEIPVSLSRAEEVSASETIVATGQVVSDSEARLSFKTGGIIDKIFVEDGSPVKKGQLLAKLNLVEIEAQVRQADEGLKKAERDFQRIQNLYRDSVATLEQLQNVTTALNVAKENVEIAKFNLSYSEIHAPMSGKILKKLMNEGELAGPGTPIFMMFASGPSDWVLKAGLTDKDFVQLKKGDEATIKFDAYPDIEFSGAVSELPESADPTNSLYPVEFQFQTQGKKFTYGMFATISLKKKGQPYVSIPVDAIVEGNGRSAYVFVPENGKARKVPIQIAFLQGNLAYLSKGVDSGTSVITGGSAYLTENAAIKVIQ